MHIRKGDNVKILAGKDRGKSGKVLNVDPKSLRVIVEGCNMAKRHVKPKKQGEKGEIITIPRSINISNIAIVCGNCKKTARIQYRVDGKSKVRVCAKCDAAL
ncbi:MAG: 50S ribosomal protein L24 [Candidatus Paceibacterota bacterium]|jgi:large subunit ribosomal protein L24